MPIMTLTQIFEPLDLAATQTKLITLGVSIRFRTRTYR